MNSTTKAQSSNVQSPTLPVIAGHEIAMDEHGRFNLNAIHHAADSLPHKRPSQWARRDEAQELIAELSQSADLHFDPIKSVRGGANKGTFAHELLAVSYAGWISPRFQLQVNQVFLDYRVGKLEAKAEIPALPSPLTPNHQRGIQKAVARKAQSLPKAAQRLAFSRLYSHLNDRFEVGSYKDIDDSRYTEALGAVQSFDIEGDWIAAKPKDEGYRLTDQQLYDVWFVRHHFTELRRIWKLYNVCDAMRMIGSPIGSQMVDHFIDGYAGVCRLSALDDVFDDVQRRHGMNQYRLAS